MCVHRSSGRRHPASTMAFHLNADTYARDTQAAVSVVSQSVSYLGEAMFTALTRIQRSPGSRFSPSEITLYCGEVTHTHTPKTDTIYLYTGTGFPFPPSNARHIRGGWPITKADRISSRSSGIAIGAIAAAAAADIVDRWV